MYNMNQFEINHSFIHQHQQTARKPVIGKHSPNDSTAMLRSAI